MTGQTPKSTVAAFGADPSSTGSARVFVRNALSRMGIEITLIEQAVLVASELVTNAVLHAQAGPVITVHSDSQVVRLEVEDSSEVFPLLRNYGGDAVTGRGLAVVDASATWWGVDATETGKTVWAEFTRNEHLQHQYEGFAPKLDNPRNASTEQYLIDDEEEVLFEALFIAVPVDVYLALEQYNEALLREFELLNIGAHHPTNASRVPEDVLKLSRQLRGPLQARMNEYRSVIQEAFGKGQSHINLQAKFAPSSLPAIDSFSRLMEETKQLAISEQLLTPLPAPEVEELRTWFLDELRRQMSDRLPPRPAPTFAH